MKLPGNNQRVSNSVFNVTRIIYIVEVDGNDLGVFIYYTRKPKESYYPLFFQMIHALKSLNRGESLQDPLPDLGQLLSKAAAQYSAEVGAGSSSNAGGSSNGKTSPGEAGFATNSIFYP